MGIRTFAHEASPPQGIAWIKEDNFLLALFTLINFGHSRGDSSVRLRLPLPALLAFLLVPEDF